MGSSICPPVQIPALAASAEEGCPAGLDGEPARSNSQIERRNLAAENHRARSTRHRFDAPSLRSVGQTYAFFVRCIHFVLCDCGEPRCAYVNAEQPADQDHQQSSLGMASNLQSRNATRSPNLNLSECRRAMGQE